MEIGLLAWGSEGDIRPFIALAAGLVNSGHEVTMAVTDTQCRDYSELAQRYSFRLHTVPLPVTTTAEETERVWQAILASTNSMHQAEMIMAHYFDPAIEDMYAAARDLCVGKDMVIGHFIAFPLRVAAARAGVPMATLTVSHNLIPSAHICPPGLPNIGPKYYPLGWSEIRKRFNHSFLGKVNALKIREGLLPDDDLIGQTWAAEQLNLITVSRHICTAQPDWSPGHQVCGFLNPPPGQDVVDTMPHGLDAFLEAGPAPVYLTFGSMMTRNSGNIQETVSVWVRAIEQAGCRAIMQVPTSDLAQFATDSRIFVVNRSPYLDVFPRCAAIVHHGGSGTTQTSLLAGKPSVVVAHIAEQYFWGTELKRLGVAGNTLWRNALSADNLAQEISFVLARPAMTEAAISIGRSIAAENGVMNAISLIENRFGNSASAFRQEERGMDPGRVPTIETSSGTQAA